MAIPHVGEDIRELMEGCLREGHFPEIWKKATLVLIPKEGKPAGLPSSYKPICLIDESAKVFERVSRQNWKTTETQPYHGEK